MRGVRWTRAGRYAGAAALAAALTVPALQTPSASAGEPRTGRAAKGKAQWGDPVADKAALGEGGRRDPSRDPGSLYTITEAIGARAAWGHRDPRGRPVTGKGVTVALLDSGVTPVPGLDADRQVVQGPDLSLETNSPALRGVDTFGHGTHLAGIIAARDGELTDDRGRLTPRSEDDENEFGVAPDASLLALKLSATDGSTDVSQVIAALDWVVQHRNDKGMRVRVVNLSFGTGSVQPYQLDPLAAAVENAWHKGLVVVVSGGNHGTAPGGLTDPAIDPYVIAVGASDPAGTTAGWATPLVAAFSGRGSASRHVDLLAPGRSVVSLRDPGSFIDAEHPEGLVAGDRERRRFRGSGTSQAAAVVSGAAALMLQANPGLTPDQVKAALVATADPVADADPVDAGAGELNVADAVTAVLPGGGGVGAPVQQSFPVSTGLGSLDAARGGSYLYDAVTGEPLAGEVDVRSRAWNPGAWRAASVDGSAWVGGLWLGSRWSGDRWSGARWSSTAWDGARWSGARWSDVSWDAARWSGARWSADVWDGARWSGARWSGIGWL